MSGLIHEDHTHHMTANVPIFGFPGLNINPDLVTAAGFAQGASQSCFLHVADSSVFKGAGLLNG